MQKSWLGFLLAPPEVGSGSGSSENSAASGHDASVTSGTASEALIAAAMASESSTEGTGTESEAELVAKATGLNVETGDTAGTGTSAGVAKPDATGQRPPIETGQAPPNRIEAAVKNARAAVVAEYDEKYGWAKTLDKGTVQTAFGIASALLKDPATFLRTLAAQEGFQVVPMAGKGTEEAAPKPFTLPKAELRSEDGKGAYSEEQMAGILKDFAASLEAKFSGQLKPLMSDREAAQKAVEQQAIVREAQATVTETMAEMRAKPFFVVEDKDGKKVDSPRIMEYLMAMPESVRRANPVAAIHRAYATYMEKDILPNYGKISEQRVREENARKAAGSGSIRPGQGRGAGESKEAPITGVTGLAKRMEEMYAAAGAKA